jgi:outer membrane protein assembly factor BamB
MGARKDGWGYMRVAFALVASLAVSALLASGCGGSSDSDASEVSFRGEAYPNVDLANTRNSRGPIDTSNVKQLEEAWTVPIEGEGAFGSYASSPVVVNGVVYSQDLGSNVQAIEQESGEVLWTRSFELPSLGPNGVAVADGRVYGATPSEAFALDQETGKQLWSVILTRNENEGIDMAPGFDDGVVYVSTVPTNAAALYAGEGVGILWALDAKTGKKLWKFNTVPNSLWGNPKVNSGGGAWYTPTFDDKGAIYFGVGNPAPFPGDPKFPFGSSRPGANLYTNSIVKLNAKTGKKMWHFQLTPHDIYDWDLQGPPILVESKGRELVLAAGKVGFVVALDAKSGKLVWKRSVGVHNGHDEDNLLAMRGEYSKIKTGTVYPGVLGGVIAPMATDGTTVFAPVVNSPANLVSGSEAGEGGGPSGGELVAIDVATGAVKWKHEFAGAPAYGSTSVTNDLVFATTFDGKVHAFDTGSGRLAWQVTLPASTNAGVAIDGDTVIAPAGLATTETQTPQIVAYRLGD